MADFVYDPTVSLMPPTRADLLKRVTQVAQAYGDSPNTDPMRTALSYAVYREVRRFLSEGGVLGEVSAEIAIREATFGVKELQTKLTQLNVTPGISEELLASWAYEVGELCYKLEDLRIRNQKHPEGFWVVMQQTTDSRALKVHVEDIWSLAASLSNRCLTLRAQMVNSVVLESEDPPEKQPQFKTRTLYVCQHCDKILHEDDNDSVAVLRDNCVKNLFSIREVGNQGAYHVDCFLELLGVQYGVRYVSR